jgi:hypothetical protein
MAMHRVKKQSDAPIHDQLFLQAKEMNMKRETIKNQNDHQIEEEEDNGVRRVLSRDEEHAFVNRMMHANKVKNIKIESMRERIFIENDITFRPQTGRPPSRSRSGPSVSEQLYENSKQVEDKKKMLERASQQNTLDKQRTVFTNPRSERVLEEMQRRRIYAIFNLLLMEDIHRDGMIHLQDLERIAQGVAILPSLQTVLSIIIPLLKEYRDQYGNCKLSFSQFENILVDSEIDLDEITQQIRTIQNEIKLAQNVPNYTHQPEICPRSEKIDRKLKQQRSIESVVARCESMMEYKRVAEEKKALRRQLQIDNELQYCTFEPTLISSQRKKRLY